MTLTATWNASLIALMALLLTACPRSEEPAVAETDVPHHQVAFFENLRERCGDAYAGRSTYSAIPDNPLAQARLVMYIESCSDSMIRIPFVADDDHSRTWVLSLTQRGLLLKHDHRHDDGTPSDTTDYGGWASADGSATTQSFPADDETARMLPETATNVWTLTIDTAANHFVYDLQRHQAPRFRAEFDLTTPVPPPRRP